MATREETVLEDEAREEVEGQEEEQAEEADASEEAEAETAEEGEEGEESADDEGEESEGEDEDEDDDDDDDADTDEPEISLGEEKAEKGAEGNKQPAPKWAKELRTQHKELVRENRKLRTEIQQSKTVVDQELGPKPNLTDEAIAYDPEKYDAALLAWNEQRRKVEERKAEQKKLAEKGERDYQQKLANYNKAKAALRIADYDDYEAIVEEALSEAQQSILVAGAAMPAELVYALGKNTKELKLLAQISDPIKFAFAVAKLEATKLKVNRKSTPQPERRPASSASTSSSNAVGSNTRLEKLRQEGQKSGDYTKYLAYKRSLKKGK